MDIEILKVYNPGEDNEYIRLRVNENCNLNKFLIYDTTFDQEGNVSNKLPHVFRFPNIQVSSADTPLIRLYTKRNYQTQKWVAPDKINNLILSWRLNETIWNKDGDKATLVEICNESEYIFSR